jgi:DNA-binding LacI/PurR family transcriptional regulator
MTELTVKPSRATIGDVAQRAGVSIATVSRVINQTAQVSKEVSDRVMAAIGELNYKPHTAAKNLASRRTNTIGLLLPEISGDFFAPLMRGVESCINQAGYDLLISTHSHRSLAARSPLGIHNSDGLLIFSSCLPNSELHHLYQLSCPMVLLFQNPPDELAVPCVNIENKSGTRKIVDHLIEVHQHRRIAFLAGPPDNEDSYWREMGYRESLAAHGINCDPALMAIGGFDEEEAKGPVRQWLANGVSLDAICAGDDESAIGAMAALREFDRRVPEDVAVVGFDDIPLARHLSPPLTTVRTPIEQAGQEAANQLVRLIRSGQAESHILLPTELITRRSCGCA